jgi:uroporphyrinogen decarboxylase
MPERLNHTDRLQALIEGLTPDRPPVAMWRHFYPDENDPMRFAEAMIDWQKRFDCDFLKINPKASYHYEPWGVRMRLSPDSVTKPVRQKPAITKLSDWQNVHPLPVSHPEFDAQLRSIVAIRKALPRPFRIVMTVFNPISVAGDMVASDDVILEHLRESPQDVERALLAIQSTFVHLVHEFRNAGADGIFFATTQWASADHLTLDEVRRFGIQFDRPIWDAAGADAFNVLHICERNNYLKEYSEFKAALTNWDVSDPTNPTLGDAYEFLRRPVMGGIAHETDLASDTPEILREKVRRLIDTHRGIPLVVGPGCAIPVTAPMENVQAVRDAVAD